MANERTLQRFSEGLAVLKSREQEALKLYRPMATQAPFHASGEMVRLVRGGNRSGKSTSAAIEFASAATGIQLRDHNNEPIPFHYPTDRPLIMWIIGWDQKHIGKTIYRLLFQPGAFKIIPDLETGKMRAYRPWDEADKKRIKECKPAPALIPERFVKSFSWENKGEHVFNNVIMHNGTEIWAFPSSGKPPQGDPADVVWVDEDIQYPRHIPELLMRLPDRNGRLFWSAFPHSANMALMQLSEQAAEDLSNPEPTVHETVLFQSSNPYLDQKRTQQALNLLSDDERRARDRGEFLTDTVAVFPSFSDAIHCTPQKEERDDDDIDKILRERGGEPPDDWTRYLVLDPGTARPAVLLAAVPPPQVDRERSPSTVVVYDEVTIGKSDARNVAQAVFHKTHDYYFDTFIMDGKAGAQTPMGFGHTIREQYSMAFEELGLRSRNTGSSFVFGSDNVMAAIHQIRDWLHIAKDGRPRIRIVTARCPTLVKQLKLYKKTVNSDNEALDKPAPRQVDDMISCLRYLAAFDPPYVHVTGKVEGGSDSYRTWKLLKKQKEERNRQEGGEAVLCGPAYASVLRN